MSDSLRIGVIGAGWFASRRHCPDIQEHPRAALTALCRRDPQMLAKMADHFGVKETFTDYRELIGSGLVDAVLVCSPHDLHYEHSAAALEAGLHVLLEKPVTTTAEDGRKLVALAQEKGKALIVAQNPPFWSHCRYMRDVVENGTLGEIEAAHIHWVGNALGVLGLEDLPESMPGVVPPTLFRNDPGKNGGGFFTDGGSHLLCELLWCMQRRVVEVTAQMDRPDWDVRAALGLRLDNGALATVSCTADSQIRAKRQHSLYYGSKATIELRGFPFEVKVLPQEGAAESHHENDLPAAPTPVDNLVECALGGGAPAISPAEAVHLVEILEAAYRSAATGAAVKIP